VTPSSSPNVAAYNGTETRIECHFTLLDHPDLLTVA